MDVVFSLPSRCVLFSLLLSCLVASAHARTHAHAHTKEDDAPQRAKVTSFTLERTVRKIADELERCALLCRELEVEGESAAEPRRFLEAVLRDPPSEFESAAASVRLSVNYLLEVHLSRFAHAELRSFIELEAAPTHDDLAALVSDAFLRQLSDPTRPLATEFGATIDGALATPLAARFLLFAALHDDAVFAEPKTRAAFITRLLVTGDQSESLAFLVRGALEPPFLAPWGESRLVFPAGPLRDHRGVVGFTAEHETIVTELERSRLEELRELARGRMDRRLEIAQEDDPFLRHLRILREWILDERHPERERALLGSSLRTRLDVEFEWRRLADEIPAAEFWSRAKPEFLALARGASPHAHDRRIAELEAHVEENSPSERDELKRLTFEREADKIALLRLLPDLFAARAPLPDALSELLACDRALLDSGRDDLRESVLAPAFATTGYRDGSFARVRLEEHLSGAESATLPAAARSALLRSVAAHAEDTPGSRELLRRVAREGDDIDRMHALTAISVQPVAVADELLETAAADCRARIVDGADSFALRAGLIRALEERARSATNAMEQARVAAKVVETFEKDGVSLWREGIPVSRGDEAGERSWRWLANAIPAADWVRLDLEGRLPEALKAYRD